MLHSNGEGHMAGKMPAKTQEKNSNVIAFPQAQRLRTISCDDPARAAVCSHCGGLLGRGESEDDCSSARISDRRKGPANACAETRATILPNSNAAFRRAALFRTSEQA